MGKNKSASGLINVINYDNFGNISFVSGSTTLMQVSSSGAITTTGVISGSSVESASLAQNSNLLQGTGSVGFTTTGSFTTMSSSLSTRTTQIESVYATTGSNSFRATQSITGSLTVTGQIIAQTINVQQVTSSIIYSSGSNVFGCDINSRQTFTGSFYQTGSIAVFNSYVGIGTNAPTRLLDVSNTSGDSTIVITSADATGQSSLFYGKPSDANIGGVLYNHCNNQMSFRVNDTTKMSIASTGDVGIGTCTPTGGISGTETALEISNSNVGVLALTSTAASGKKYQIYSSNDGGLFFRDGTCSAQRMMISTLGNVGIGTTSPANNRKLTVSGGAQFTYGDNSGASFNIIPGTNGQDGADFNLSYYTGTGYGPLTFTLGGSEKMRVISGGNVGIGATSPIAKLHTCTAYNANNLQAVFGNSNGSINCITYDTVIVQQDDVTTFKMVERNIGSVDQVLTLSVGDSTSRISTTCSNPLQFFVGGTPSGCGYNGLSGINALSIASSGTSTFNYPVNMGAIGHYTNYRSTSGCFAIFCASQGAILYVTSMHNNGRATYQLVYSNGPTGGASISVIGSTSAYGPASTSFGLCANGWVYGYQQYGGPTDYYAIAMNGNFQWAF
jgi:hypothetical protein